MTEQELENIISDLAYRRKHTDEDSAEYKMIMRQLEGIRREGYLAARFWKSTNTGADSDPVAPGPPSPRRRRCRTSESLF